MLSRYDDAAEQVRNPATGAVYILLEAQLDKVPGAVPKAKKGKGKAKDEPPEKGFEVCPAWTRSACPCVRQQEQPQRMDSWRSSSGALIRIPAWGHM